MKTKRYQVKYLTHYCFTLALAGSFLSLHGFAQAPEKKAIPTAQSQEATAIKAQQEAPAADAKPLDTARFGSRRDRLSYAFGVDLARGIKAQGINLNVDLAMQAFKDALAGNTLLMSEADAAAAMKTYEEESKQDYEHAKLMIGQKNKRAGEAFVAENVKKEGVVTLPSGLQYKILKKGAGKMPTINDAVECHYRGTLLDGKEFDSSYKRNEPSIVPLKKVIKGLSEGLQLMPVGSKWQIFIPPHLAYGDRVVGGIGPNAMLVFEVELLGIKTAREEEDSSTASGSPKEAGRSDKPQARTSGMH